MATKTVNKSTEVVTSLADSNLLENIIQEEKEVRAKVMKSIYVYLKAMDPDSTSKRVDKKVNWIICRDYKMEFKSSMGFMITDLRKKGKICEDFKNPFPTPQEVWEYINRYEKQLADYKPKEPLKVTKVELPSEVKKEDDKPKKEEQLQSEDYEKYRADLLRAIEGLTISQIVEVSHKFIPNRKFNHRLNKLNNAYKQGELRGQRYKKEFLDLVATHDFSDKKRVRAPKFEGLNWYKIVTLKEHRDVVTFTTTDNVTFTQNKSEFLTRYLLHDYPKTMPQVWRFIHEEISYDELVNNEVKERDEEARYIDFDPSILRKQNFKLAEAVEELFWEYGMSNPLNLAYKNDIAEEFKSGDHLHLYFATDHLRLHCRFVDYIGGVRVRAEDGTIYTVVKGQKITRIK